MTSTSGFQGDSILTNDIHDNDTDPGDFQVVVAQPDGSYKRVNAAPPIDLGNDGYNPHRDGTTFLSTDGPNAEINAPLLAMPTLTPDGMLSVHGTWNGTPNTTVTFQFFAQHVDGNAPLIYIGSATKSSGLSGDIEFLTDQPQIGGPVEDQGFQFPSIGSLAGLTIIATATDQNGNTSEFSVGSGPLTTGYPTYTATGTATASGEFVKPDQDNGPSGSNQSPGPDTALRPRRRPRPHRAST